MEHLKILKNLNNDLFKFNNNFKSVKFFSKDFVNMKIWFIIFISYYNNKNLHSEDIISQIPREYASRITVFRIIDDAVKKKFVLKIKNINDKRKFNIIPSATTIKEFESWCLKFNNIKSSITR